MSCESAARTHSDQVETHPIEGAPTSRRSCAGNRPIHRSPIGTTAEIVLYTKGTETVLATWTAISVTEDYAEFRVESEQTDLIPAGATFRLYIHYPETPTLDLLWVYGDVQRKQ